LQVVCRKGLAWLKNLVQTRFMPDANTPLVAELREVARQLLAIAERMEPKKQAENAGIQPVRTKEEVAKLVAERTCLECGEKLNGDDTRRGCHGYCYQKVRRLFAGNDEEAVSAGLLAPAQPGGRPSLSAGKSAAEGRRFY